VPEDILQDDATPLCRCELEERRDRGLHGFVTGQRVLGIIRIDGCVHDRLQGLAHPAIVAAEEVDRAPMCDAKQPGTKLP
jgi:hypothetical protein